MVDKIKKNVEVSPLKTKEDFIEFFEAIPATKWCKGQLHDSKGRHCAIGHLGKSFDSDSTGRNWESWYKTLRNFEKLYKLNTKKTTGYATLVNLNDASISVPSKFRKLKGAKKRVLAFLKSK